MYNEYTVYVPMYIYCIVYIHILYIYIYYTVLCIYTLGEFNSSFLSNSEEKNMIDLKFTFDYCERNGIALGSYNQEENCHNDFKGIVTLFLTVLVPRSALREPDFYFASNWKE